MLLNESLVPKVVHQIAGKTTTPLIETCLKSWNNLKNKGFEIKIWNDELIASFILEQHEFAYQAFVNARNHAEAADIARYLIIYTFGGYYADWDVEVLDEAKFLALTNQHPTGFMLCDPLNNTLASEFFCAIPEDMYLLLLTMDIVYLYESGMRNTMKTPQYSGPYRMRDSLSLHPKTAMTSIPVKTAFAYDYLEIRNPPAGKITQPLIHYWLHSWIKPN